VPCRSPRSKDAYNEATAGKAKHRWIAVTIRERGKIVAGLLGQTYFDWMYVRLLWVADRRRGRGWGRSLIAKAEAEALRHGVRNVWLDSFTFQAPDFYKKLGYREFGRLKGYPAGHDRVFLTKAL
jgi:GNAT superfamily N-acetyltransferase